MKVSEFVHCAVDNARGRSSWNLGMWMGRGGGYFILIKTFVVQVLIKKMLRVVVDKIIIQGYLENADRVHVFLKNIGSLMNSLREIAMKILM